MMNTEYTKPKQVGKEITIIAADHDACAAARWKTRFGYMDMIKAV
jgi:hypothetical protein